MKSIHPDCFTRYIFNYHGTPVILENYQDDGEDECWGTYIFDLKNRRYLLLYGYFVDEFDTDSEKYLDLFKDEWESLYSYVDKNYDKETLKYYRVKIKEYEKAGSTPYIVKLDRPIWE